jgi:Kelch motif/Galactose oxidase, central domain
MTKGTLMSLLVCVALSAPAAFAQTARRPDRRKAAPAARPAAPAARPTAPAITATQGKPALALAGALPPVGSLYSWQARPDDIDGYFSTNAPQPVCGSFNGVGKIYIFTNFDHYPSVPLNNNSLAVRVGEIDVPADTYQLLSQHSLPGRRQNFTATSVSGAGDSTIYLFGGTNGVIEMNDVYSYTPSAGFNYVGLIPNLNSIQGNRSGAAASQSKGMVYLFGGRQGSGVINQVLQFDPQTGQFAAVGTMPEGFYGARAMTKAVASTTPGVVDHYIYLVGGITQLGGAPNNKIYRFNVQTKQTEEVQSMSGGALTIPPGHGYPTITWDPSGNIRIIAAGDNGVAGAWTWGNIQAWVLNDNYPPSPNVGKATLTPSTYNDPARARDMAGAVKCGDAAYLIGGTYGHGSTFQNPFQNRGQLVDRLSMLFMKKKL